MARNTISNNSIFRSSNAVCTSNLVLPVLDAAILLVVSVLVCLRVIMLGT